METLDTSAQVRFLTVPELAALLRARVSTVYEWTRRVGPDAIPCYRAGKRLVFDPEEAVAWFKDVRRKGVLWGPRRSVPNSQLGGRVRRKPTRTGLSAGRVGSVALPLPGNGPA